MFASKSEPRLSTPSLRNQYLQSDAKNQKLGRDTSNDVQVLALGGASALKSTFYSTGSLALNSISAAASSSIALSRAHLLSRERPPTAGLSRDKKADSQEKKDLSSLAVLCRRFEQQGIGQEVPQLLAHNRMRGLDFLYNKNRGAMSKQVASLEEEHRPPSPGGGHHDRAEAILWNSHFFQVLEASHDGIIKRLSKVVKFKTEPTGQVMFRQGDLPGNCYVLARGRVGVRIWKETDGKESRPTPRGEYTIKDYPTMAEMQRGRQERPGANYLKTTIDHKEEVRHPRRGALASDNPELESRLPVPSVQLAEADDDLVVSKRPPKTKSFKDATLVERIEQDEHPRCQTVEASSTFTKDSKFGTQEVELHDGSLFGELALNFDKPRAASIVCLEDCEFLVIQKQTYRRILKEMCLDAEKLKEAVEMLKKVKFFKDMEATSPGIVWRLATGCRVEDVPKGQVIFRQGDAPGNCYVVMSGNISVCIAREVPGPTEKSKRDGCSTPRLAHDLTGLKTIQEEIDFFAKREQDKPGRLPAKKHKKEERCRYKTLEGFHSFDEDSFLGPEVGVLGPGAVFGEKALEEDHPRAASTRCRSNCRFLIIDSKVYTKVAGEIMEKVHYFSNHLPGLRNLGYRLRHPSIHFQEQSISEGFTFLFEGIHASEAVIYLIRSGIVEFRRYRNSTENPAYVLSSQPLQSSSWKSRCGRPVTGVAGSDRTMTASGGPPSRGVSMKGRVRPKLLGRQVTWDMMDSGAFCSLPFFPISSPEPFTAVAVTPMEVYIARGSHAEKLLRDQDLMHSLCGLLLGQIKDRVRRLPLEELDAAHVDLFCDVHTTSGEKTLSNSAAFAATNSLGAWGFAKDADGVTAEFSLTSGVGADRYKANRPASRENRPTSAMRVTFSNEALEKKEIPAAVPGSPTGAKGSPKLVPPDRPSSRGQAGAAIRLSKYRKRLGMGSLQDLETVTEQAKP
ncbi:unnamed protein product [Polarella glacialis]|uniref:Cyclic nucleotide-binding domain-containing protein n=1 Tax=Polarella glacialis TaxID=89957 RepID=A0A813FCY6_POLGL|nr:unnamed protein product [Polarella glacialis]